MRRLPLALYAGEARRACRRLLTTPVFAAGATLAVAFAVTPSVVFRLVQRAVLPPLPYEQPEDLVVLWRQYPFGRMATSFPSLDVVRRRSRTLDLAIATGVKLFLTANGRRAPIAAMAVTPSFFRVLGARMRLGRAFTEEENRVPLARPVVVISEAFWRRELGARPDVVGQSILLNDAALTVVGVAEASFPGWWGVTRRWLGFADEDAWIPAMMAPVGMVEPFHHDGRVVESPNVHCWVGLGRMRPGSGLRRVRAELDLLQSEIERTWQNGGDEARLSFAVVPAAEDAVDPKISRAVSVLTLAGLLVALLGAINVGGLFLARGLARARTLGLERVLGAPRALLVFGTGIEALLVGTAGAALALLLARGAVVVLGLLEPSAVRTPFGVSLDAAAWRMGGGSAAWALGIGTLSALAGSLAAAWRTTAVGGPAWLRTAGGSSGPGLRALRPTRPRGLLVVAEIAFAVALTLPALLLVRSVGQLVSADLGFRTDGVWATPLALPVSEYGPERAAAFVEEAVARLRCQRSVAHAAWVSTPPLQGSYTSLVDRGGVKTIATVLEVTPGAFGTLGIPIRGRDFTSKDAATPARAVVLSELAARQLAVSVGGRVDVAIGGASGAEVVGIAGDVPYDDPVKRPLPVVYVPLAQSQAAGTLLVQSDRPDVAALVQDVLSSLDRSLGPLATAPLAVSVDRSLARFRAAAWLLGTAALVALCLSAVGVYGVLSSLVALASPEVGIRIALGATPGAIAAHVLGTALALGGIGLLHGLALGLAASGALESYFYRMSRFDAWALALAALVSAALALAAAWNPALRAMRVDPIAALRSE
jgi:predicted permease